jgi:hypothetical protein
MTQSLTVTLLLAVAFGLGVPLVLFGLRLPPRMDARDDDPDADVQPLVGWPPTAEDRAHMKRLGWVLAALAATFVLLLAALLLTVRLG